MQEKEKPWFCYMLRCRDGALYVGVATDVQEREKEHSWRVGANFTAKRRPVKLIWWQEFSDQQGARRRERELKGWRREKKLELTGQQAKEAGPFGPIPSALRVTREPAVRESGE